MPRDAASTADLLQFTGLRGLAAFIVLLGHVGTPVGVTLDFWIAEPFARFGVFGVDIFFVLSGFILCHVYADRLASDRRTTRDFFIARFSRIYPLHVVTLFLMLGAYLVSVRLGTTPTVTSGYSPQAVVLSLLLVSEWFEVAAPNPGSWSISVEFINYLYFPLVTPLLATMRRWYLPAIALGALVIFFVEWRLVRGVAEFVMGCAAFYMARDCPLRWTAGLTGALLAAPFLVSFYAEQPLYWLAALFFTGTVYFLSSPSKDDLFIRLCSSRPLVFLGDVSLSIYLLQWFVWVGWKHILAKTPLFTGSPYAMVFAAMASLVAISAVSYYTFELPLRLWLRRRLDRVWTPGRAKPSTYG
jgi:peptidoglycan/LPS O-acetylase OafA/YrhL